MTCRLGPGKRVPADPESSIGELRPHHNTVWKRVATAPLGGPLVRLPAGGRLGTGPPGRAHGRAGLARRCPVLAQVRPPRGRARRKDSTGFRILYSKFHFATEHARSCTLAVSGERLAPGADSKAFSNPPAVATTARDLTLIAMLAVSTKHGAVRWPNAN